MAIGENFDAQKLFQKLERLPAPMRGGVLGLIALLVVGIYFLMFFGSNQGTLRGLQTRRAKVEQDIQAARAVANNLESFKKKREELGAQLQAALEKLPESSDLPALLTNISTLGKKSGLEIQTFKQGKKIDRGFYSEQQIELEFTGMYHDIALFFDRVASLSRIVNLTDLTFTVASDTGENPNLKVKGIAATFYFNESMNKTEPTPASGPTGPAGARKAGGA
ncbi:MAG TPA: type 4a pilus biogenesis protein PilO [Myxococcota bacterium]|nr:type 4a pilus biogenesis protein PilO [Myxococcota bacterium]